MYQIKYFESEPLRLGAGVDTVETYCELFKVIGEEITHPYRVRLIDKETGEVGPQIRMFTKLSSAAKCFDEQSITW